MKCRRGVVQCLDPQSSTTYFVYDLFFLRYRKSGTTAHITTHSTNEFCTWIVALQCVLSADKCLTPFVLYRKSCRKKKGLCQVLL